jgi:hypothetical protein
VRLPAVLMRRSAESLYFFVPENTIAIEFDSKTELGRCRNIMKYFEFLAQFPGTLANYRYLSQFS